MTGKPPNRFPVLPCGWTLLFLVLAACAGAACAGDEIAEGPAPTVTDSAGVEIVHYSAEALAAVPVLTPSDTFEVSIGSMEGEEPYLFSRVMAAAELSDGTIVVVDRSEYALRWFDAEGRHIRSVGRLGQGPGEFQGPDGWWLVGGDTIKIWDEQGTGLVSVTDTGKTVTSARPPRADTRTYFIGGYQDGSLLFWHIGRRGQDGTVAARDAIVRALPPAGEGPWRRDTLHSSSPVPRTRWAPQPLGGIHPRGAWSSNGIDPEIRLFDHEGRLLRIVRWHQDDPTVTDAHWEAWVQEALDGVPPGEHAERRAVWDDQPRADRFPATVGIRSRMDGTTWIMLFERPGEDLVAPWMVVSPDGRIEARLRGWDLLEPLPATLDRVVTLETDELDVPRVRVRRLVPWDGG